MELNKYKITGTSFLSYFIMATIISPLGIISTPMSEFFGIQLTEATAVFSILTSGLLIGSLVAMFIFDYLGVKSVIISQTLILFGSILAIYFFNSFTVLKVCFLFIGLNCGILLSTAVLVISITYSFNMRSSMLLATDTFYSIGGMISTYFAGVIINEALPWHYSYLPALLVILVVAILAIFSKYPLQDAAPPTSSPTSSDQLKENNKWPIAIYFCGFGLFIYLIGFVSIYTWIPTFVKDTFGSDGLAGSKLISSFFMGQLISQIMMFFLVHKIKTTKLIIGITLLLVAVTTLLWMAPNYDNLFLLMIGLGLIGGGLLKVALSYGTLILKNPSSKLVTFLVFCTGLGSALSPYLSSKIVEMGSSISALQFATACYILVAVLFGLMIIYNKTNNGLIHAAQKI